jgi:hypothetical protein
MRKSRERKKSGKREYCSMRKTIYSYRHTQISITISTNESPRRDRW